jgi:hypothetical protein
MATLGGMLGAEKKYDSTVIIGNPGEAVERRLSQPS